MPRIPGLTMLACALLWPAVFIGCASQDAYRYETIKTEYADMACNLGKSQAADTPPATCAVNSNLTLQDVLDIARDNNPDLLMALARIERARAMLENPPPPSTPR
jgi:outer membrane protein